MTDKTLRDDLEPWRDIGRRSMEAMTDYVQNGVWSPLLDPFSSKPAPTKEREK